MTSSVWNNIMQKLNVKKKLGVFRTMPNNYADAWG